MEGRAPPHPVCLHLLLENRSGHCLEGSQRLGKQTENHTWKPQTSLCTPSGIWKQLRPSLVGAVSSAWDGRVGVSVSLSLCVCLSLTHTHSLIDQTIQFA